MVIITVNIQRNWNRRDEKLKATKNFSSAAGVHRHNYHYGHRHHRFLSLLLLLGLLSFLLLVVVVIARLLPEKFILLLLSFFFFFSSIFVFFLPNQTVFKAFLRRSMDLCSVNHCRWFKALGKKVFFYFFFASYSYLFSLMQKEIVNNTNHRHISLHNRKSS